MSSYKEAKYKAKIKVEHFPSRNELLFLINNYLENNSLSKEYKAVNQDSLILLIFKNSDIAFEVAKRLKVEQLRNPIYSKMEVSLTLIPQSEVSMERAPKMKRNEDLSNKRLMTIDSHSTNKQRAVKGEFTSGLLGSSPYLSIEEKERIEKHQGKLKWLSKRNFNAFAGPGPASTKKLTFIPNYVGATPSEPPVNFKFREIHKEKWTGSSTFK